MSWTSVIENFIADAAVAIIFGFFLTWLITWRNRPKLELVVNLNEPTSDGRQWASIIIVNRGKMPLKEKELYWHIYWPHNIDGKFFETPDKAGESKINETTYSHFRGLNKELPIFPGREIEISSFWFAKLYKPNEIKVKYHFSTILGTQPNRAWTLWRYSKLYDKNGDLRLNLLPVANIRDIRNPKYRGTHYLPPKELSGKKF